MFFLVNHMEINKIDIKDRYRILLNNTYTNFVPIRTCFDLYEFSKTNLFVINYVLEIVAIYQINQSKSHFKNWLKAF